MKLKDFTYLIDDDFLSNEEVQNIHDTLLNGEAKWVLGKSLLGGYRFKTDIEAYAGTQFNHLFFLESGIYSPYWSVAFGLIKSFCIKNNVELHAVVRCKANLTFPDTAFAGMPTETPHVDHHWQHFTLLYYVNDALGETIVYNEQFDESQEVVLTRMAEISPKAGRAVLFNGQNYHSPTVPEAGYRAVINTTFLGEFK
jgi:hypothetical protein